MYKILVLNPGSTSTKVAYYEDSVNVCERNLDVDRAAIAGMKNIFDQMDLRKETIRNFLDEEHIRPEDLSFIVSRGGGGGNLMSGGYLIDEALVQHCYDYDTPHASSLGPVIAYEMGKQLGIPAFIYDGEGVNEFIPEACLSGFPAFPIAPGSHTLNAKAAARIGAARLGGKLEDFNIVVCHLGGGTSTSAHCRGKLIDSTSDGYSAERAGGVPFMALIGFVAGCFSGKYTQRDILKMIMGGGGLAGYLGTSDLREVEKMVDAGDEKAKLIFDGMVYAQAKDIGAMATTMNMDVDAIVLTGGMAHSKRLVEALSARVGKIAPIIVAAGSHEMDALANGAIRLMNREEKYHKFGKDSSEDAYV
jgi:butyrate kinase